MADREFLLRIVGDVSDAKKKLGEIDDTVGSTKKGFGDMAKAAAGAFAIGGAIAFGKSIAGAASDQEQAFGAVNSVFKDFADEIHGFGEGTAESLGISQAAFENLAASTGALLKNAGVPLDEVAASTMDLTTIAADLAATYGGTAADAMAAMNSALKGEMDPLEKFAVSLKASSIEAKALEMGLVDSAGKATDYGKKMATIALIQEQSADATGAFAREAGTMAGQTQIMGAKFKDLQADLGQKLLPTIVQVAGVLTGLITFIINNQSWLLPLAAGIGAIVLGMKAWSLATQVWEVATKAGTIAQGIFNAVMAANPIFLIIAAIVALTAGFVLLYMKVDWFREAVDAAIGVVKDIFWGFVDVLEDIGKVVETVVMAYLWPYIQVYELIKEVIERIPPIFRFVVDTVTGILSAVWDTVSYPYRKAYDLIKAAIELIPGVFTAMVSSVSIALSNVWNTIKQPFVDGASAAMDWIANLLTAVWEIPGKVYDFMVGVADALTGPFESAFNSIKALWNDTVGGFGFSVPGWVPGVGGKKFEIPRMASGGIVTRPTIALLGEAGAEAIVPLDRAGGLGGNVVINVYALTANAEVGRKVYEALREYERTTGKPIGLAG